MGRGACHAVFWTGHDCYIKLQELWLSAPNLHKNQPGAPCSNMGKGRFLRLHLYLKSFWQLMVAVGSIVTFLWETGH